MVDAVGQSLFQSTHPVRGGTFFASFLLLHGVFQSTHPVRGGTAANGIPKGNDGISIHPPREGWDGHVCVDRFALPISIHPPREGWDLMSRSNCWQILYFNPPTP